ncbi:hypothetical protein AAFF_G00026980 [Aldrovandia affinis]|uniref:Uncharacterized protein n=1 Tax=Aldrovandia affinis TaxID=143900 RepID=A0AAD7R2C9_9TELE|nr:hypothetical protein AAFF_G00026980 [Aldrovandia affinis]
MANSSCSLATDVRINAQRRYANSSKKNVTIVLRRVKQVHFCCSQLHTCTAYFLVLVYLPSSKPELQKY